MSRERCAVLLRTMLSRPVMTRAPGAAQPGVASGMGLRADVCVQSGWESLGRQVA